MTFHRVFVIVTIAFLIFSSCGAEEAKIAFQRVDTATLVPSSIPEQNIVIADQVSLQSFWTHYGTDKPPQVDFELNMVVGVFLGSRPDLGYDVKITDIGRMSNKIEVYYVEYVPDSDAGYLPLLIYPYDMVLFPRTTGEVVFIGSKKFGDRTKVAE